jgi:hypothetical protein
MTHLTEQLELLFDAYMINETDRQSNMNLAILKGVSELREKQKVVRDLLVEDSLFRKALTGDVRACVTWLNHRMPSEWNASFTVPPVSLAVLLRELQHLAKSDIDD